MSEGEVIPAVRPRKSKTRKILLVFVSFIALAVVAEQIWYHHKFPYGWSHCCDIGLGMSLQQYAQEHAGKFPSGGDSPEASLSLLYSNYTDAYMLRGKTVPLKTVEQALATKGELGSESCGWHYVEGLTLSDDDRIAIVWDKVGLGHNGERIEGGGHSVIFVNGFRNFVSEAAWPKFLQEQQELLAHRSQRAIQGIPALTARIRLPSGEILTNCPGSYELITDSSEGGHGTESGENLELRWYGTVPRDGESTWTLILPGRNLHSKPVTVTAKNGENSPNPIIFEMENN